MGDSQNWRQQVDAQDFFGFGKKAAQMVERRPVIKRASQLVGPGIGANAVRLTDLNDLLATYNGYYAALSTAANAPSATENFVGYIVQDSTLGGVQVFTGLTTGIQFQRIFLRNPSDASSVLFGAWTQPPDAAPATLFTASAGIKSIPTGGISTALNFPTGGQIDTAEYTLNATSVALKRTGLYMVDFAWANPSGATFTIFFSAPNETGIGQMNKINAVYGASSFPYYGSFVVRCLDTSRTLSATANQNSGGAVNFTFNELNVVRLGDV